MNYTIKKLDNGDFEAVVVPITELSYKEPLDICIICGKDTQYTRSTNIDNRIGYIEGCGQTCTECYKIEIL
jgi:hypothetical protein